MTPEQATAAKAGLRKGLPAAAALALPILGYAAMNKARGESSDQQQIAQAEYEVARAREAQRNAGDVQALRARPSTDPYLAGIYGRERQESEVPQDLAAFESEARKFAERCGRVLAKTAGIGTLLGTAAGGIKSFVKKPLTHAPVVGRKAGWKTQAALGAGTIGLGYAGYKGTQAASGALSAPVGPVVHGSKGLQLPRYVNEYGVPT